MTMGDLETVVRQRLPICIVIMNDSGLRQHPGRKSWRYGDRVIGVDFIDVDYATIAARGFGIASRRADSAADLASAMKAIPASGAARSGRRAHRCGRQRLTHPLLVPAS